MQIPVGTTNLLEKVKAACYLSMKEYWKVPTLTGMIATILDTQLKKLSFNKDAIKRETIEKLRSLYSDEKFEDGLNDIIIGGSSASSTQRKTVIASSNSILNALFDD